MWTKEELLLIIQKCIKDEEGIYYYEQINPKDIYIKKITTTTKERYTEEELLLKMQQYGDYVCNQVLSSQKPYYKSSKEFK